MRIAIHQNKEIFDHSTSWDKVWIKYCEENNIDYEVINCFDNKVNDKIFDFDILLWHFSNYSLQEMLFARTILYTAKNKGIVTFPNFDTSWHFDDKIAEKYLLESINAPIPASWVFYTKDSAKDFFKHQCKYPIIAKLKSGSGSNNVKLIKSKSQAIRYAKKMFGSGINSAPNIFFKAKSNIRSSKSLSAFKSRFKRIPDFINTLRNGKKFPKERGYVYLQEFIPNDGYDLKVVVVNNKISFLARNVRNNDFRASGGGDIFYDKNLVSEEIKIIAKETSNKLNFLCMGYDFVINNKSSKPYIVEISYGFSHTAQMELNGHWDENNCWIEEKLNAPEEIIKKLINDRKEVTIK